MVPPRSRAGESSRSGAVECIVIGVSEAREARRLALTRPAVPLNIAARSPLLLLYTSSVFGRKSKLAWLPRAYRTPMMPCCRPTARGLSVAETPRVKAQPRKHRQPTLSRRALLRRLHHLQRVACQQWYTSPPAPDSTGGETSKMMAPCPCKSCGGRVGGTALA